MNVIWRCRIAASYLLESLHRSSVALLFSSELIQSFFLPVINSFNIIPYWHNKRALYYYKNKYKCKEITSQGCSNILQGKNT